MGTGNTLSLVSAAGTSAHFRFSYQESFRAFRIVPRAAESLSLTASGSALVLQSASGSAAQIFIAESASRSLGTSYTYQDNGNYLSTVTDDKGNKVTQKVTVKSTTKKATTGTTTGGNAAQTFDIGVAMAFGALAVSGIGFVATKKRK